MENIFTFFNKVYDKEFSTIEDIINDLSVTGIKSSNNYYKSYWSITEIRLFSDNKKGLFMNSKCCGMWGGWLHNGRELLLVESEDELKIKYLEHVMNEHSKYYPL